MDVVTISTANEIDIHEHQVGQHGKNHDCVRLGAAVNLDIIKGWFQREGHDKTSRQCGSWTEVQKECRRQEQFLKLFISPKAVQINSAININTGGKEHDVLLSVDELKVYKRLKDPKHRWGRAEWTPYDYIESIALFNELAPPVAISVVGTAMQHSCVTLVTEMPLVVGPYPSPEYLHSKLEKMGFVQYVDGVSKTIDYRKDDIILYDAHYKNFILDEATGDLVPIDLQIKRLNS